MMSGDFDPCECIRINKFFMQRLLSIMNHVEYIIVAASTVWAVSRYRNKCYLASSHFKDDTTHAFLFMLHKFVALNCLCKNWLQVYLRQTQHYCSDNECFDAPRLPGPPSVQQSSNFFITCLFVAFLFLMYITRPRSLRNESSRNNVAKTRDDISGSSNDPPAPPPTGN